MLKLQMIEQMRAKTKDKMTKSIVAKMKLQQMLKKNERKEAVRLRNEENEREAAAKKLIEDEKKAKHTAAHAVALAAWEEKDQRRCRQI